MKHINFRIKSIFGLLLIILQTNFLQAHQEDKETDLEVVRKVADYILSKTKLGFVDADGKSITSFENISEDKELSFASKYGEWHYTNGVINLAMIHLAAQTGDEKYYAYAKNHIAHGFDNYEFFQKRFKNDRPHHRYPLGQLWTMLELDDFGAISASMLEVMERDNDPRYETYIKNGLERLTYGQDRLYDKTLVRTFPQKMTLWADDLYMSVPFLSRSAVYTGENKYFDDAINQVLSFDKYLWNPHNGLYFHCYYTDTEQNGVAHWGRSNGWLVLSQLHLLERLPEGYPGKEKVRKNLEKQLIGLSRYQDQDGLWRQLLDKNDSYQETSASAMFVQGFAKAITEGWIDKRFASVALRGWEGLRKHMIEEDGQVRAICVGTGISDDLVFYYTRSASPNEKHGVGSVIDAGLEVIKLKEFLRKN
ncbi:glycoside hydrolase family 88 protein [Belliella sp. DSM 111904]|uniref:Glycoside hydrolase family 88 protein n=1 Tax=Belliella filtrata TaxID=2923435 RepID=A0ABS9UYW5_9BACT|nr:glycoside hydrolase family 88 protein [Belliella filtrata]MCH7409352.1 glycoside hydrolase family 88 protein [Belliella filtrata]